MELAPTLHRRLAAQTQLTDSVGDRIFPVVRDPDTGLPCLVYSIGSGRPEGETMSGDAPLQRVHVQIDILTEKYDDGWTLFQELRNTLERWSAAADGVQDTFLESYFDLYDDATRIFRVVSEWRVWIDQPYALRP